MNIPKMLVFDLDGTLLDDNKRIPEATVTEINRLYTEYGIIPVIATARPLEIAKMVAEQGGEAFANSYIIATNGGVVYNMAQQEYTLQTSLSPETLEELIKLCNENNLEFEIMTNEREIAWSKYKDRRDEDPMYTNAGKEFAFEDDLAGYIRGLEPGTVPLFAISGKETELNEIQSKLDLIQGASRTAQNNRSATLKYYDIMQEGVSKDAALRQILEILKIEPESVYVFGDGGNDIPMLNTGRIGFTSEETKVHCEIGVYSIAPANAKKEVKDIADFTTPENNNTGAIANFLKALRIHLETYYELKRNGQPTIDDKADPDHGEGPEL